jgi:PhoH-like ATPase
MIVLEELDRFKTRQDDVGKNARLANRLLDELREQGSLVGGVKLRCGGTLRIALTSDEMLHDLPVEMQRETKADNVIIALTLGLYKATRKVNPVTPIMVSKDINMRIKCDVLGIKCEDYKHLRVTDTEDKLYTGVKVQVVSDDVVQAFYDDNFLDLSEYCSLYPNQAVVLKSEDEHGKTIRSVLAKCKPIASSKDVIVPIAKITDVYGLRSRNKEQALALDMLLDNDVKLVTLSGRAGCGKTLLALAAGLQQLKTKRYSKIIVTRPIQPLGKDIGFLPGTMEEKMEPWIAPIRDNIGFLMSAKNSKHNMMLDAMMKKGEIEIEAITYIRGRSIPNAYIIVDECQNITLHELKTILTRVGEGSKVVATGDSSQIDNVNVDMFSNGLTHVTEKFKDQQIAAHITLLKGERGTLATLAADIL